MAIWLPVFFASQRPLSDLTTSPAHIQQYPNANQQAKKQRARKYKYNYIHPNRNTSTRILLTHSRTRRATSDRGRNLQTDRKRQLLSFVLGAGGFVFLDREFHGGTVAYGQSSSYVVEGRHTDGAPDRREANLQLQVRDQHFLAQRKTNTHISILVTIADDTDGTSYSARPAQPIPTADHFAESH